MNFNIKIFRIDNLSWKKKEALLYSNINKKTPIIFIKFRKEVYFLDFYGRYKNGLNIFPGLCENRPIILEFTNLKSGQLIVDSKNSITLYAGMIDYDETFREIMKNNNIEFGHIINAAYKILFRKNKN